MTIYSFIEDPYTGEEKFCNGCKENRLKTKDFWHKHRNTKDGLAIQCKICRRKYSIDNSNKIKEYHNRNWLIVLLNKAKTSTYSRNKRGRNIESVTITKDWILEQLKKQNGKCYWTNVELFLGNGDRNLFQISLDRLNNDLGYTPENTVLSSYGANFMRNTASPENTRIFINSILEANKLC